MTNILIKVETNAFTTDFNYEAPACAIPRIGDTITNQDLEWLVLRVDWWLMDFSLQSVTLGVEPT